jgi:hypothetical protein
MASLNVIQQWTRMLDVVEDYCELRGVKYGRLDGSTPRSRRSLEIKLVSLFGRSDRLLLISVAFTVPTRKISSVAKSFYLLWLTYL